MVWSHLKKKRMKYLSHEVNGLLPGVRYQFQVPNNVYTLSFFFFKSVMSMH